MLPPTREDMSAQTHVRVTCLVPRSPSWRRSRKPPMRAPATKPKPLAAPRRITSFCGSVPTMVASHDRATLVTVMPAMMKVGVQASSRA